MNERKPFIYLNNERIAGKIVQPSSEETRFRQFPACHGHIGGDPVPGDDGIALSSSVQSALDKSEVGKPALTREAQRGCGASCDVVAHGLFPLRDKWYLASLGAKEDLRIS